VVDLHISIDAEDTARATHLLYEWLAAQNELRGRVRVAPSTPEDGTMGALADVLVVAVGSGGLLTVLLSSLVTWITRPKQSRSPVISSIKISLPDGTTICVDGNGQIDEASAAVARRALSAE
jgi:Effector Associated Constant Component 1